MAEPPRLYPGAARIRTLYRVASRNFRIGRRSWSLWISRHFGVRYFALLSLAIIIPIGFSIYSHAAAGARYHLSSAEQHLIGSAESSEAQLTYNKAAKQYVFNKAAFTGQTTFDKATVGGGSTPNQALYGAKLMTTGSQTLTLMDSTTQLSMSMTPLFSEQAAKSVTNNGQPEATPQGSGASTVDHVVAPIIGQAVDHVYTVKNNGIKEDLLLTKAPSHGQVSFSYRLNLPDTLTAKLDSQGDLGIYSADPSLFGNITYGDSTTQADVMKARQNSPKTNLVFVLPAPVIYESGSQATDPNGSKATFTLKNNVLTITATNLSNLTYPATIDPSVVVTAATDWQLDGNNDGDISYSGNEISTGGLTGGGVGTWTTSSNTFTTPRDAGAAVAYNGYLYIAGGCTTYGSGYCSASTELNDVQYAAINSGGSVGAWQPTTNFTTTREDQGMVAYNGYMYIIGGDNSSSIYNDVQYARINANGTLGTWQTTTSLPDALESAGVTAYDGYLYVVGGWGDSGVTDTVYYASLNADGTVGAWQSGTPFTTARGGEGIVAYNGYLYVLGGYGSSNYLTDVQYAPLGTGGSVGTWSSTTGLSSVYYDFQAVAYDGYIYTLGGCNGSYNPTTTVNLIPINANGTLGTWQTTTSFSNTRESASTVAYNGYLYVLGGYGSSIWGDTQYAKINPAGVTGNWTATTSLPASTLDFGSVAYNGYVYAVGGNNGSANVETVEYASISSTGTLGSWTATTSLPTATEQNSVVAFNGYVYSIGGYTTANVETVDYALIGNGGTLGSWTATTTLPVALDATTSVTYNNYLYVLGGDNSSGSYVSTVYYASISSGGTLGSWSTTTALPQTLSLSSSVVYGGYIYEIGGADNGGTSTAVYDAPINNNGTLGSWTTTSSLPTATYLASAVTMNGYIYEIGGQGPAPSYTTTSAVYYAPISSNGTLGSWAASTSLPLATAGATSVAYNGYVYEIGGENTKNFTTVDYAPINNGGPGTVSSWNNATDLPDSLKVASSVSYNGYLYELAGNDGAGTQQVYYDSIGNNGALGEAWNSTGSLPQTLWDASTVAYNGYLYEIGGYNGSDNLNTVYYAQIDASNGALDIDGPCGQVWCTTATLPQTLDSPASVVYNGYIYVLGGQNGSVQSTVYYASINSNGTLNSWNPTTSLPQAMYTSSVVYNGYVYAIGGYNGSGDLNTVYYALLNSGGTVGTWATTTTMPVVLGATTPVAYNGYLYDVGGSSTNGTAQAAVYYAPIDGNGTIGNWTTTAALPNAQAGTTAVYDGYVYLLAGEDSSGIGQPSVYYAGLNSIPRVGEYSRLIDLTGSSDTTTADDPVLSALDMQGTNDGNQGSGGGVGGIRVAYEIAGSTCPGFGAPVVLGVNNSTVFSSSIAIPEATTSCGVNSNGRYVWADYTLDDSQTATFPDVESNHTSISQVQFYYHPGSESRLRGGQTLSNGVLTPLDTSPLNGLLVDTEPSAPTIVGTAATATQGYSGVYSPSLTTSSSTVAGDLVIIAGYVEPANEGSASATFGTITTPTGVNLLPGFPIETDAADITTGDDHRLYVWYYYATANGSQTLDFSDNQQVYWGLSSVSIAGGPTSGNPLADAAATATISRSTSGVTSTPPVSLTLGGPNSLVLWAYTDWSGTNPGSPSGYTAETASTNWSGQPAIAAETYSSAGSTGTVTASRGGNDDGMTAALLSFRSP